MSSPRFKSAIFNDSLCPITLEDTVRLTGAFAGVHDFDFQNKIDEDFASGLGDWTLDIDDGTTWNTPGGVLEGSAAGNPEWYQARHTTQVAPSFVASFDLMTGEGAFLFHGKTDASTSDCYIAWWNGINCGFSRVDAAKAETSLTMLPFGIVGPARIQVAVTLRLDSVDDSRKWLQMSMFVDGREIVCYAEDIAGTPYDWDEDYIGFAVTGGRTCEWDNLTVQEFHRIVDYVSVDPDETPSRGLSRAMGTTHAAILCRYDGTVRVWRPGNRSVDWAIPTARAQIKGDRDDRSGVVTHLRVMGAIHSVDRFDDAEGEVHMHRFARADDPNLMTELEVYAEAGYQMNQAREVQKTAQLAMPGQPLAERLDVVTYDGVSYRVMLVTDNMIRSQQAVGYTANLKLRRYLAI